MEAHYHPSKHFHIRDSNSCRIHVRSDERTGRIIVFATIWRPTSSRILNAALKYASELSPASDHFDDVDAGRRRPCE